MAGAWRVARDGRVAGAWRVARDGHVAGAYFERDEGHGEHDVDKAVVGGEGRRGGAAEGAEQALQRRAHQKQREEWGEEEGLRARERTEVGHRPPRAAEQHGRGGRQLGAGGGVSDVDEGEAVAAAAQRHKQAAKSDEEAYLWAAMRGVGRVRAWGVSGDKCGTSDIGRADGSMCRCVRVPAWRGEVQESEPESTCTHWGSPSVSKRKRTLHA